MGWEPGRLVVQRSFQRDLISLVKLCRVVSDDERGLLLWLERGSAMLDRRAVDGRGLRAMPFAEWLRTPTRLHATTWRGSGILKLIRPGQAHSVWWFFGDPGVFTGWYVNLEEPAVRWSHAGVLGVDYVDQDLDVLVSPAGEWRWKDEDEFTERLAYPEGYWVSSASAVWDEGKRVIALAEAGEFPFDGSWCDFQPDPGWTVPTELPAGWDRPRAR
ncbi:MAG TPA: DUF402 domain-containing protein [Micromonosporaceae bacterium]|nr:DUF402 domain-containing protein [Micromonosporaceae bacterium]